MKPALLDTDTVSWFLKSHHTVSEKVQSYVKEYGSVNMSIITYYEAMHGLLFKDAKKQLSRFIEFSDKNVVLSVTKVSARLSARIFADLRKEGTPIGHTDTLIAGIALANNLVVVTNNTAHFTRIKNLEVENWME